MSESQQNTKANPMRTLAIIPFGIALNLAIGTMVSTLKIPLYLDAIATIAITLLAGWRAGVAVGVGSFLLGGVLVNPVLPWFSCTQAVIAIFTSLVASKGWLRLHAGAGDTLPSWGRYARFALVGIALGVVAGAVSAPIIVWLFSGITGSGPSLVVAVLLKSGETLFKAVLYSGFASEPLDKGLQLLFGVLLVSVLPRTLKQGFGGEYLERNGLLQTP